MKHILKISLSILVGAITLILISTLLLPDTPTRSAQADPVVIPTLPPQSVEFNPNYRIAYLVAENAIPVDSLLFPETMRERGQSRAEIAHSMADLQRLDAQNPLEAIILHRSALDVADPVWIEAMKRRGVVLATINITRSELAEFRDNDCARNVALRASGGGFENEGSDYFYISSSLILAENAADQALMETAIYEECQKPPFLQVQTGGQTRFRSGFSQGQLASEADMDMFLQSINGKIIGMRSARRSFENRHLPPTPVPAMNMGR